MKSSDAFNDSAINIIIENEQDKLQAGEELLAVIRKTIISCFASEGFDIPCEIDVTLTDNECIRDTNKQFRNIDTATDVLSFPMVEMLNGDIIKCEGDTNMEDGLLILGDILVSLERAKQQAEEYGHSFEREVSFLVSHGVFHLLGYDHQTPEQEKNMFGRQEAVLEKLGFVR